MNDPSTGPLSRDELRALSEAPFGKAVEAIRRHDPFWGRADGEMIEWEVECRGVMFGRAYVKAANEKDAEKLADRLTDANVSWDFDYDEDFEIVSIAPAKRHRGTPISQLEPMI